MSDENSTIPPYILKKIFKKGCASITDEGFSVKIVNEITPFLITIPSKDTNQGEMTFKLDDRELDIQNVFLRYQEIETPYLDFRPLDGTRINMGDEVELVYKTEEEIDPTKHTIEIFINSPNPVRIKFATKFHKRFI